MRARLNATNLIAHLGSGRGPYVFAVVHGEQCASCGKYRQHLLASVPALHEWSTHLIFEPITGAEWPTVIVADEWGEVFYQVDCTDHTFPTPSELVEWARFVAIQCEECEQPEGEWND